MDDKLKITITRMRGYDTVESREIVIDFPHSPDEDLLRKTFTKAENAALDLRTVMDIEAEDMEQVMALRAPVEVSLLNN